MLITKKRHFAVRNAQDACMAGSLPTPKKRRDPYAALRDLSAFAYRFFPLMQLSILKLN